MRVSLPVVCLAFLLSGFGSTPEATAAMNQHRTAFDVYFGLLPVAKATFAYRYDDRRYRIDLNGETVGIAGLVAPGEGRATSNGFIRKRGLLPVRHLVFAKEKHKRSSLVMRFKRGRVDKVSLRPRKDARTGPDYVEIKPHHLAQVLDPASTLFVMLPEGREPGGESVCDRVLKVYDGETRFDIRLTYKRTETVETGGFDGDAYVCSLRYVPVAGHEREHRNVEYMASNEGVEIWMAAMAGDRAFSPIRIEVPTWIGRFRVLPTEFAAQPSPVVERASASP